MVKQIFEKKPLVYNLELTYSLKIQDFNCLTEKTEIEKGIKREHPEITNTRIGITSATSRGQKYAVVEIVEQYAGKFHNNGKIIIDLIVSRIRIRGSSHKCC